MKPVVNAKPYARLDQLYLQILTSAIPDDTEPEDVERYQVVVGSIARLRASLPLRSLASLTGYDIGQIRTALHHLHSVIVTPLSNEDPAQIYHPSFVDFLCNPQRCNDPRFFILTKDHERRLALRCLDLLKPSLKRNLAGIPDYVLIWDTFLGVMEDGEKAFVGRVLTPELEYCCRNWPSHLGATPCGDPLTMDALEDFASRRLLWWFEAASLVGVCVHIGAAMNNIYEWAVESRCTRRLCQLLHDGVRFSSRFEGVIKCSPHLIYQAGVVFLHPDTVLAQTYTHEVCTPRDLELTGFTYVDDFVATRHDVSALISSTTPPSVPENTDRWGLDDSPSTLFMRAAALIAIAVMTINHGSRKASGNPFGAGLVPCLLSATDHRSERVRRAAWNCIYETCDLWTSQSSDDTLTLLARKAFRALLDENEHWEVTYAVANVTNRSLIWSPSIDVAQGLATRIGQLLLLSDKEIAGTAISLATRAIESEEDVTMRLRVMKEIGWRGIARWASHASPRGVRRKVLYALHRFACESTIAIDVLCSELGTTHLLDILASTLPPDPVHAQAKDFGSSWDPRRVRLLARR
ncbi:hypothetical protein OF83DRAFT_1140350 [Amylostereum chailletii]|nr:hypothetical protein OF83DRAFT_1140350 [Amylostereum chailletii]